MGKKFVGLDGLKHFWQKIKTKIEESQKTVTAEIAKEVTARTNADISLQTAIDGKSDKGHTHTKSQITDFAHTHDDRYFTKTEITNKLAEKSDTGHTHDDRYFTEKEITNKLAGKSDTGHNHDDRYYTESEIDTKLSNKVDKVSGKGLSTNDYTTAEKNKLAGLKNYDDTEVRGLIEDETTRATTAENNLSTSINNVKSSAVTSVNYDSTNKKITKTINGTTSDVVTLATMKTAMALNNVTNVATESTITKDSTKNITSGAVYTLKQTVDSNKSAIDTLNGTGTGSVKKTVTDEIAKVVANAPADFDTLKEISDWIDTHEDSASAMNTAISKNATNLSNHTSNKSNPHSVTKAQVGLGNVGNFKAVSTVANQGLTDDEKANARANIGAGMSSFSGSYTDLTNKPTSLKNPNALTVNGKTYDGSSAVNAGVQTIANGGTGQTTAKAALNSFINSLDTSSSTPGDNDYYVSQYVNGGTTNTTYLRRPMSLLWEYIKGKISSVLGLTATAYGGKASTAGTADKTVNDITIDIPYVNENGQYVIPLGNILEPTSTEINSPYNWDITGFFSIIRATGHSGSHVKFEAGHGYSHARRTYAYLDSENFDFVSTAMKAFQYNGKWWLGLYISTQNPKYVGKMTITYSRGLPATPTCILYNSRSGGVANEEIYNSIQDIPSSWWGPRTIHNPTTFIKGITAPNITSLEESVAGKSDIGHNHDDRYYTESEIDTKLSGKADKSHTHTKSQITDFPTSLPANGGTASKVANSLTFGSKTFNGSSAQTITASDLGALTAHQTIKQDGITGATVNRFGTCSTAADTAAKTVSITTGTFSLEAGARVSVKFSNANTASTPTLNVASKGAKNIFHKGVQITTGGNKALLAGVCDFIYDGTQWHLVGNYIDTNTTYSNFVKSGSGAKSGLVPAPSTTAGTTKYLREDGTWTAPPNTTYSSKSAASGGTDVSLVTTGEKYTWNSKAAGTHYHTNLKPSNHDTNDVDYYPMWANGIGDGSTARSVYTSTDLKYNPKNKTLKSTNFSGNLSGTASNAVTATTALKIPTSQPAALEAGHIWVI